MLLAVSGHGILASGDVMSAEDRDRGRKDAERDKYSPPKHSILLPESEETFQAVELRKGDYDEGWAERKLELNADPTIPDA
jgi:hypothetical protein